jgi:hypothetical protein
MEMSSSSDWPYFRGDFHWRNNIDTLASSGRKGLRFIAVMMNLGIDSYCVMLFQSAWRLSE